MGMHTCLIPQSCRNVVESRDCVQGEMQKGSELGAAQEQVSQPKHWEIAKLM